MGLILITSQNGAEDIKRHRWFKVFDWQDVIAKKLIVSENDY
jgi:hypothetical protein